MIETAPTGTFISSKKPINYVYSDIDAEQVYCVITEDKSNDGTIDFTGVDSDFNLTAETVDTIKVGDVIHAVSGANQALFRVISTTETSETTELVMHQYINEIGTSGTAIQFYGYTGIATKILNKNIDTYDFRTDVSGVVSTIGNIEHTELLSDGFDDVQNLREYKVFFVAHDDSLAPYLLEADSSRAVLNINSKDVIAGENATAFELGTSVKKPLSQLENVYIHPRDGIYIYFVGEALKARIKIYHNNGTISYQYLERASANKDIGVLYISESTIGLNVNKIDVRFINPSDGEPVSTELSYKILYPDRRYTARFRNEYAGWDSITFTQIEKMFDGVERDIECKVSYLSNTQLKAINGLSRGAKIYGGTDGEMTELWTKKRSSLEYTDEALAAMKFNFTEVE